MATVTLKNKKHLGSGNFEYTFQCNCGNSTKEVKVTSGNDLQAKMLAQMECDDICDSSRFTKKESSDLKQLIEESGKAYDSSFIVSVKEIGIENYSVYLCTGDEVSIPKELVKSFDLIGVLENNQTLHQIGEITFNTKNGQGFLVRQLSEIIEKVTTPEGEKMFDSITAMGEKHIQIKVPCSGKACNPKHSFFTSQLPIIQHSLRKVEGCSVNNVTKIGSYKLRVLHSSLGGMICGTSYNGRAYFDIVVRTK